MLGLRILRKLNTKRLGRAEDPSSAAEPGAAALQVGTLRLSCPVSCFGELATRVEAQLRASLVEKRDLPRCDGGLGNIAKRGDEISILEDDDGQTCGRIRYRKKENDISWCRISIMVSPSMKASCASALPNLVVATLY